MIFKKSITIIISLIFLISLNIYFDNIIEKYVIDINNLLNEIKEQIKNEKIGNEKMKEIDKILEEAKKRFVFFVDHEEIEKAEIEITLLKNDIENREYYEAIEKIEKAKYMFDDIKENSKLKIKNIF